MQNDIVNIERYSMAKVYFFQLQGPIMLYLYSGDPFSCNLFFCIWIYINKSHKLMQFLSRLCQGIPKVNAFMLKCFKIIFQRFKVWKCFFAYGYLSVGAINSAL